MTRIWSRGLRNPRGGGRRLPAPAPSSRLPCRRKGMSPRDPSPPSADTDPKGRVSAGVTESVWTATHRPIRTRALDGKEAADVCVVGAGIAGLTTAYYLSISGEDVVVLE